MLAPNVQVKNQVRRRLRRLARPDRRARTSSLSLSADSNVTPLYSSPNSGSDEAFLFFKHGHFHPFRILPTLAASTHILALLIPHLYLRIVASVLIFCSALEIIFVQTNNAENIKRPSFPNSATDRLSTQAPVPSHVLNGNIGGSTLWDSPDAISCALQSHFNAISSLASVKIVYPRSRTFESTKFVESFIDSDADLYSKVSNLHWTLRGSSPVSHIWTSTLAENPWDVVRGRVEVPASVGQLVSLLTDDSKRSLYDKMFVKALEYGSVFGTDSTIPAAKLKTLVYSGSWPVSKRHFHVLAGWTPCYSSREGVKGEMSDLGALIVSRSFKKEYIPKSASLSAHELNSTVHARIYLAGFVITPLSMPSLSEVTMFSHVNFEGHLPPSVINFVQTTVMPDMLDCIRRLAPLEPQQSPHINEAFQKFVQDFPSH